MFLTVIPWAKQSNRLPVPINYDLYILTAPDFAFVQDGTREGKHIRLEMHQWFIQVLNQKGKRYIMVEGSHEQRMTDAIALPDASEQVYDRDSEVHSARSPGGYLYARAV